MWVVCESVRGGLCVVAGCLVLVRGGWAFRAVGEGLRLGVALVDVRLDVVPLPPRSSSPNAAGCRLGGILLDPIGWVESAVWEACYPAFHAAEAGGCT